MISKKINTEFISRWRVRYGRGLLYTTIPMTLFSSISLSLLWIPYLREYGVPTWLVYVGAPMGFLGVTLIMGYIDETRKWWERETYQFNKTSNPYLPLTMRSLEQIDRIEVMLDELCKRENIQIDIPSVRPRSVHIEW